MNKTLFTYCPQCGSENHQFDGKHFLCNACAYDYFHNTAAACAIILVYDEKILFTVRNQEPCFGALDLPGGFIEAGESLEFGLKREVMEELGIDIQSMQYMASFPNTYPYKTTTYTTCDAVFIAKLTQLPLDIQLDEIQSYKLLHPSEIVLENIPFSSIRNAVQHYIEHYCK